MNPFPPQAYTRETMIKAYQWLQSQSAEIRQLAITPDLLISLFQKAQMQGKEALERPSLQNFKSELKNLAGMIGEFEIAETSVHDATAGAVHNPATMPPQSASASFASEASASHASKAPAGASVQGGRYDAQGMASDSNAAANAAAAAAALGSRAPGFSQTSASGASDSPPQIPNQVIFSTPTPRPGGGNIDALVLDSKSLEWLEEIQRELNLESTAEALRLALSVGYGRLSDLFPRRR